MNAYPTQWPSYLIELTIPYILHFIPVLADCGDPSPPLNGFVMAYDSTLEDSQIVFQCNPGFTPSRQMMSVCMADGIWTPSPTDLECRGTWLYCDCLTSSGYMIVPVALSLIQLIVGYPSLSVDL